MTNRLAATIIMSASVLMLTPSLAQGTPTMCEFISVELFAAAERGQITEKEAYKILKRCQAKEEGKR